MSAVAGTAGAEGIGCLDFESSKVAVLTVLIRNPGFANAGKAEIVRGLDRLAFDSSKSHLLALINGRGALVW